jgi:hypothetical protein
MVIEYSKDAIEQTSAGPMLRESTQGLTNILEVRSQTQSMLPALWPAIKATIHGSVMVMVKPKHRGSRVGQNKSIDNQII